jgi:nickel/cobalt transporter (NicO) family protein
MMMRLFALLLLTVAASEAAAHPLGLSSINRYAGIRLDVRDVEVDYLLDLAELPAYAELALLDPDHDGVAVDERERYLDALLARIAPTLTLTVDGKPAPLRPVSRRLRIEQGQNGLSTLLVAIEYRAARGAGTDGARIFFRDKTFADRPGWREIELLASPVARVASSSGLTAGARVGASSTYPSWAATSPRREDEVTALFSRYGASAGGTRGATAPSTTSLDSQGSTLAELVRRRDLSLSFLVAAFALAFALGAGHALTPGHGKTLVAIYLVGHRARIRDALILGLAVTVTHTASVFILGISALAIEQSIGTARLFVGLEIVAGVLVILIAIRQLPERIRHLRSRRSPGAAEPASVHDAHDHDHDHDHVHGHDHSHGHEHDHAHVHAGAGGVKALIALGISGGIVPCPGALVVLLTALSLHRLAFGVVLLIAFSLGLATVLSVLGVLCVLAKGRFDRISFDGRTARILPVVSSTIVLVLGIVMTLRPLFG